MYLFLNRYGDGTPAAAPESLPLRGQTGAPDAYGPERGSRTILGQDSASLWIGARGGTLTQRWALGYGGVEGGPWPKKVPLRPN